MSSSPCRQLRDWLDWVSDSSNNPWPDGSPDPSPVHPEAEPVDPTHAFNDVSDEWTDDDSSSEEVWAMYQVWPDGLHKYLAIPNAEYLPTIIKTAKVG